MSDAPDAFRDEIRKLLNEFNGDDRDYWTEDELRHMFKRKWAPRDANLFVAAPRLLTACLARLAQQEAALRSIANNSCCTPCQEAALVARQALAGAAARPGAEEP